MGKLMKKSIPGFEGKYSVDTEGYVWNDAGGYVLEPHKGTYVRLIRSCGVKGSRAYGIWHRIDECVAGAFLPNPNGWTYVKHLDGDVRNNRLENLEYCKDRSVVLSVYAKNRQKKVWQMDRIGNIIAHFDSAAHAEMMTGVPKALIARCCRGEIKTAHKFVWCYAKV
jgi:hypothetical protein